jgi:hypothetical protein
MVSPVSHPWRCNTGAKTYAVDNELPSVSRNGVIVGTHHSISYAFRGLQQYFQKAFSMTSVSGAGLSARGNHAFFSFVPTTVKYGHRCPLFNLHIAAVFPLPGTPSTQMRRGIFGFEQAISTTDELI